MRALLGTYVCALTYSRRCVRTRGYAYCLCMHVWASALAGVCVRAYAYICIHDYCVILLYIWGPFVSTLCVRTCMRTYIRTCVPAHVRMLVRVCERVHLRV